ncbi:F-box/LRR-repeat protein 13-like [Silene latifolia]|uniref:F-box/LRR-repeat protein 13-like n=1 Tax=Silene latifolia TaxID=37657 RepID=UPI003D76E32F
MEDILNNSTLSISEKPNTDTVDRLSSLPDHLISEILSNLDTNSAVATSILSRHWRHQWTNTTRISLSPRNITNCHELHTFLTTTDNILQKLSSPPSNLRTFDLDFKIPYTDIDHFDNAYELCRTFLTQWFHRLCSSQTERFRVSEQHYGSQVGYLTVCIQNSEFLSTMSDSGCSRRIESSLVVDKFSLCLPECIFQSKTLVELIITINFSRKLPNYFHLPNLKRLSLQIYEFDHQLMPTIFKSLPLLEDLDISVFLDDGDDHFIDISAPNLKNFTILGKGQDSKATVLIDAPKLEHISILTSWDVLVLFRFLKIPIHLLTTILMHWSFHGEDSDDVAILGLVKAISHTRSLDLCCPILNVMNSYELPTFHNLVDLSLVVSDAEDMNLGIPASILGKVKTIKVRELEEYEKGMSLIEDILSKANVLEWLSVSVSDVEEPMDSIVQKENDFVKALFMLPRVSSTCEIKFYGQFVYASTKVNNGSVTYL